MWFSRFLAGLCGFYVVWNHLAPGTKVAEGSAPMMDGGSANVQIVRLVVFIVHERAKERMYAWVRSDLSGVIRRSPKTVERDSSQPRGLRRLVQLHRKAGVIASF